MACCIRLLRDAYCWPASGTEQCLLALSHSVLLAPSRLRRFSATSGFVASVRARRASASTSSRDVLWAMGAAVFRSLLLQCTAGAWQRAHDGVRAAGEPAVFQRLLLTRVCVSDASLFVLSLCVTPYLIIQFGAVLVIGATGLATDPVTGLILVCHARENLQHNICSFIDIINSALELCECGE